MHEWKGEKTEWKRAKEKLVGRSAEEKRVYIANIQQWGNGETGLKEKKKYKRTIRRALKGVETIRFVLNERRRMVREYCYRYRW